MLYYNQILSNKKFINTKAEIYGKTLRKKSLLQSDSLNESENIDLCKQAIIIFQKIDNKKEVGTYICSNGNSIITPIKYLDLQKLVNKRI